MADKEKNVNITNESIEKSKFEFVQKDNKIYDKKFQTKPIGYFKDAMIRFAKNKTNVVATSILSVLILLSIFVPILSSKNATAQETELAQLPPRIPVLEKIGIADGMVTYEDRTISYDNPYIDPETGMQVDNLYLPADEFSEYIQEGSVTNYWADCTNKDLSCENGVVELQKNSADQPVGVYATLPDLDNDGNYTYDDNDRIIFADQIITGISNPTSVMLELAIDPEHRFNENVTDGTSAISVYLQVQDAGLTLIKVFDSSDSTMYDSYNDGVYTVDIANHPDLNYGITRYKVLIEYDADINDSAVLESFKLSAENANEVYGSQGPDEDYLVYASGYFLSRYRVVGDVVDEDLKAIYYGNILRIGGQRLNSTYTLDAYAKAFGKVDRIGFPASEYEELIQGCTYADGTPVDPDGITYAEFDENCPITILYERNNPVVLPGRDPIYSYDVQLNYRIYAGYDDIPYFLFGTSAAGYDMVKLIWIGLQTSLLIGLLVSTINIAIGVVYGAISGYYGGQVDIIMQRFAEIIGRIPWLVTLSIFMAYFEAGFTPLILILIVSGWIGVGAITRTQFYRYKGREYVLASRTLGAKDARLIFRHILPNGIGTIITSSILLIPTVIFSEATLSYLGFGIGHGQKFKLFGLDFLEFSGVSIGVLLNDGRNKLQNFPHLTLFPAIIISILMITFNMFGNALRDAFNPALRGSE